MDALIIIIVGFVAFEHIYFMILEMFYWDKPKGLKAFGMKLEEVIEVSKNLMNEGWIDCLDISLWDSFKEPYEEEFQGRTLMSYFTELDRGTVKLGVAGKISTPQDAQKCLQSGADFVSLGRAAILHHDFPRQLKENPDFIPVSIPVTMDYLRSQGLGEAFVQYMAGWEGFVENGS